MPVHNPSLPTENTSIALNYFHDFSLLIIYWTVTICLSASQGFFFFAHPLLLKN